MTKTAFIKSLDLDMPAKTVVAEGAKKDIKLSEAYVHNVRSGLRSKAEKAAGNPVKRKRGRPPKKPAAYSSAKVPVAGWTVATKTIKHAVTSDSELNSTLRRLVSEIGTVQAMVVIQDVHQRVLQMVGSVGG